MNPYPHLVCLLSLGLAFGAQTAPPERDDDARFRVQARLEPAPPESADGRFAIQASAKLAAGSEQRFTLKSTAASCAAAPADKLFEDQFE